MLFGLVGAALGCGLQLGTLRGVPQGERPDFRDPIFWVPFAVWVAAGAAFTAAYERSGVTLTAILSLHVGASAPLILRAMVAANPFQGRIDPGAGA